MKTYRIRYEVKVGDFARPSGGRCVRPGITVSEDDYGFADELVLVSVVKSPEEPDGNMLMISTEDLPDNVPSQDMLRRIIALCNHYLEKHTG